MRGKIIFIAPDKKLFDKAKEVIHSLGDNIEVYQGSLNEGLKLAKQAVRDGANIIISRGGTGDLIKRSLQIPVVNLETNGFDIINSISEAIPYSKEIGVAGFENLVSAFERVIGVMQKTFSIQIITASMENEGEAEKSIGQLYDRGARVFIGGNAAIKAAKKLGYNGVFIESGYEAIADAVRHAKNLLEVQMKEKERAEILKSIIDFAYDGIFGIGKDGRITVFNPVAEKIIGISAEEAVGKAVSDVVENTRLNYVFESGEAELGEIQSIGGTLIVTNRVPIVVDGEVIGVVATFQELERIQKTERQIRKKLFLKGHVAKIKFDDIIGMSNTIMQVKEKAKQFAEVDSTVLIMGETGVGKELFAQSIHNSSPREDKPFVAVNCAALPENLLESELFGYVEGAFTGARKGGKMGLFELAHGGTIFLDEISEMSSQLQARFLRVLQEKEVVRIGDDRVTPVDIRVIAATNRDLFKQVEKGGFREDLYYRLCVLRLEIPPLRKRTGDIAELVRYFIKIKSRSMNKTVEGISEEALNLLKSGQWLGNVRQLENIIERLVVLCQSSEIDADLVFEATDGIFDLVNDDNRTGVGASDTSDNVLKKTEQEMIKKVLEETKGNRALAAEKLGISTTTLWRRLKAIDTENM